MKAITVEPGVTRSVRLDSVETPPGPDEGLLVRTLAVGICGTDTEIINGVHGAPPSGRDTLVIGHESLGVVESAPDGSGFEPGEHVVGIVRRPDPVPCACCAVGEWDRCSNGLFVERGIKQADGFAAERFMLEPSFAIPVDRSLGLSGVLLEPASILAKAWRHIDAFVEMSCSRARNVLVIGAGPIGLLAAMFGAQRGLEVHVLDHVESGPKPGLVERLGASYHSGDMEEACPDADITLECTGVGSLAMRAMTNGGRNGIVCLTGVSKAGTPSSVDVGLVNLELVLDNKIVFGTVNANRGDYQSAATALSDVDPSWRADLITREVPLASWHEAYDDTPGDVKTVLVFD